MFCIIDKDTNEILIHGHTVSCFTNSEHIELEVFEETLLSKHGLVLANCELRKWNDSDPLTDRVLSPYNKAIAILNEDGEMIDIEIVEPLSFSEEPVDIEKVAIAEAIIDLETRLSELEEKQNA